MRDAEKKKAPISLKIRALYRGGEGGIRTPGRL
jgi:hypothetical protein